MRTHLLFAAVAVVAIAIMIKSSGRTRSFETVSKEHDDASGSWNPLYPNDLAIGQDRCTIERIWERDLTPEMFQNVYWRKLPLIIMRDANVNEKAQHCTQREALLRRSNQANLPLAKTESYSFRGEEEISLRDYLFQTEEESVSSAANQTTFAFGTDVLKVGDEYHIPSVVPALKESLDLEWQFQLALPKSGAGLAFHWHGDVFAEVLHGRRRWFLSPPDVSPVFDPRVTSAQWVRDVYSPLYHQGNKVDDLEILECTMEINEALYVPAEWFHSTLSLGQAVSLTMSFAPTFRRQRYTVGSGTADHSHMLDALAQRHYVQALFHARALRQHRPRSFHPHAWLGVLQTLYAQTLPKNPTALLQQLQEAREATGTCRELNPLYAPCHVWQARQLEALALLVEDDDKVELLREARDCRNVARALSHEEDDELLDPRWQPRSMKKRRAT